MPTSFLSLSLQTQGDNGQQLSGFPPIASRGWTGNQPTVRQFTLTGEADTTIAVPAGTLLIASPMTDLINLWAKGIAADTGIAMCHPTTPLNIPWLQPWDGEDESFVIENLGEDDAVITLYFY